MSKHPRRTPSVLTDEQTVERFDTDGESFAKSLRLVLAGGPDDGHGGESAAEREASDHG